MGVAFPITEPLIKQVFQYHPTDLQKNVLGLHFTNPVGLGAGFDKNALYLNELDALGFGFVEIGTITPKAQAGNEQPRLFRLPHDKALINRMGFNNNGDAAAKENLAKWNDAKNKYATSKMIVGGNIGKNKITPNEFAWQDYKICFNELFDEVDYFVVNVSSPNTPGLRELQEKDALKKIFSELQNDNAGKLNPKPLLLKIAPDLTNEQLDDIISLAFEIQLSGLVATNTTIDRSMLSKHSMQQSEAIGMGGLSGKPVSKRSAEVLSYLAKNTENKIPLIASGGIFTGEDAADRLNNGAALVQVWTGFVYEGPAIVKNICKYLSQR
jgi:dihydroorotate dehydrogenase